MTVVAAFLRRHFPRLPAATTRLFEVEPGTRVRAECHWQENPKNHPTLVMVHGLEGSSESDYLRGTAEKAWVAGFNAVRLNQRTCGGTEALAPTLYHSGLSCDIRAVVEELIERDGLPQVFTAGFSMGGNLVLKMAGEWGYAAPRELRGIAVVAPTLDLATCADAIAEPRNFLYNWRFVSRMKRRMRLKASLFPELYPMDGLGTATRAIRTIRDFDDLITARFCDFRDADDYYARSSALQFLPAIRCPTLIVVAQDDPIVPFRCFENPAIRENPCVTLLATRHGGHCAFISCEQGDERFWAEARIVEFCGNHVQRI